MKKVLILLIAAILSSGCGTTTVIKPSANLPPPVRLPSIGADELSCLSDSAYRRLVVREKRLKVRIDTLEGIIRAVADVRE